MNLTKRFFHHKNSTFFQHSMPKLCQWNGGSCKALRSEDQRYPLCPAHSTMLDIQAGILPPGAMTEVNATDACAWGRQNNDCFATLVPFSESEFRFCRHHLEKYLRDQTSAPTGTVLSSVPKGTVKVCGSSDDVLDYFLQGLKK